MRIKSVQPDGTIIDLDIPYDVRWELAENITVPVYNSTDTFVVMAGSYSVWEADLTDDEPSEDEGTPENFISTGDGLMDGLCIMFDQDGYNTGWEGGIAEFGDGEEITAADLILLGFKPEDLPPGL